MDMTMELNVFSSMELNVFNGKFSKNAKVCCLFIFFIFYFLQGDGASLKTDQCKLSSPSFVS